MNTGVGFLYGADLSVKELENQGNTYFTTWEVENFCRPKF